MTNRLGVLLVLWLPVFWLIARAWLGRQAEKRSGGPLVSSTPKCGYTGPKEVFAEPVHEPHDI